MKFIWTLFSGSGPEDLRLVVWYKTWTLEREFAASKVLVGSSTCAFFHLVSIGGITRPPDAHSLTENSKNARNRGFQARRKEIVKCGEVVIKMMCVSR
jgi:hypothetical protein